MSNQKKKEEKERKEKKRRYFVLKETNLTWFEKPLVFFSALLPEF